MKQNLLPVITLLCICACTKGLQGEAENDPAIGGFNENQSLSKGPVTLNLEGVTATTVTFTARLDVDMMADYSEVGLVYSKDNDMDVESETITVVKINKESYKETFTGLQYDTDFYYTVYTLRNNIYSYGKTQTFRTNDVTICVDNVVVTNTTSTLTGKIVLDEFASEVKVGIQYSLNSDFSSNMLIEAVPDEEGDYAIIIESLYFGAQYHYRTYICQNGVYEYGESMSFTTLDIAQDLSINGTANCYIVSKSGKYKMKAVKGNSNESVEEIASAHVLWESFGTDVKPNVGDLITWATCSKTGYIGFETPLDFKEGNAVIAAKDASGKILWSWHIWLTDEPQGQVYYNNAGIMMDRSLGATSVTPGDIAALGLLYQWGRKDPFLGSSWISSNTVAKSTITWPSAVSSNSSRGTIAYATANPTTFITLNNNYDWQYSQDNTRWTTSSSAKSVYDPCPAGWRIPDGGRIGVWSKALGSSSSFVGTYDSAKAGMNFSGNFGAYQSIWYPASGLRSFDDGSLSVGYGCGYWSASPDGSRAYYLDINHDGSVNPSGYGGVRANGMAIRCLQE